LSQQRVPVCYGIGHVVIRSLFLSGGEIFDSLSEKVERKKKNEISTTCNKEGTNDRISSDWGLIVEVEECTWDNPTTKGDGGAIYLNNHERTELSIKKCSFKDIHLEPSYFSGCFDIQNIASVILSSSSFHSLSSLYYGVGCISSISKCVLVDDCECDDYVASSYDFGGMFIGDVFVSDDNDDCLLYSSHGCLFSSSFSHCIASTYSGGLSISSISSFSLRSSIFHSCSAGTDGGGICMDYMDDDVVKKTILFYCFFQWK
jgi:hypothetical protein